MLEAKRFWQARRCEVADVNRTEVTVVQPGEGETVAMAGFEAVIKLSSRTNGGEVAIVEHPFAVGTLTAAHRHTGTPEKTNTRS
jgi:hypothetical protein